MRNGHDRGVWYKKIMEETSRCVQGASFAPEEEKEQDSEEEE
jgi:hypothetical protein